MRKAFLFTAAVLALAASGASAQTNLAYWNFNDATGTAVNATQRANLFSPDGGLRVAIATMTSDFLTLDTTTTASPPPGISFFGGSTINALNGDPAGVSLALQGSNAATGTPNNGKSLTFGVSTVGFNSITISFATQRTATGFNSNQFQYFDGSAFVALGAPYNPATAFALQTFDLTGISAVANNPAAQFRIVFNGVTSTAGNNRIENLQVNGAAISAATPEPGTIGLLLLGASAVLVARRRK